MPTTRIQPLVANLVLWGGHLSFLRPLEVRNSVLCASECRVAADLFQLGAVEFRDLLPDLSFPNRKLICLMPKQTRCLSTKICYV